MTEHPAVVFLREALDEADQTAYRLHTELWWVGDVARFEAYLADGRRVGDIHEHGRPWPGDTRTTTVTEAIQRALLSGSPTDLLRRVEFDRQILAEHKHERVLAYDFGWRDACATCRSDWPCRTVRLLAEAWGWTEDAA